MTKKQLSNTNREGRTGNRPDYPDDSRYYSLPPQPYTRNMRLDTIWDAIREIRDLEYAYEDFKGMVRDGKIGRPNYSPQDTSLGVLGYLGKEYIDSWKKDLAIGGRDGVFEYYMREYEPSLKQRLERYIGSSKEEVKDDCGGLNDIAHLAFSTFVKVGHNFIPDHWGSWGGDLATGMADVHYYCNRYNVRTQELVDSVIGAYPGYESRYLRNKGIRLRGISCNFTDLCDDADSIALAFTIKGNIREKHAISDAMRRYYDRLDMRYRFSQYRHDGFNINSVGDMKDMLIDKVKNCIPYTPFDNLKKGATDWEQECACDSLANYIYEMAR